LSARQKRAGAFDRAHLDRRPFFRAGQFTASKTPSNRVFRTRRRLSRGITMSHYKLLAAASGLALLAAASAHAQTAPAPASDAAQVDEVVVTGVRKSLRDALDVKRGSDKVVEAISAKDIGVLPDVTIAESIARLPGVNATRDRGNDSQAVVRGLGARLVLGTINGREVASSEPDRNVRWEIYPSEVVSGRPGLQVAVGRSDRRRRGRDHQHRYDRPARLQGPRIRGPRRPGLL
jgi:hypothetical protein